MVNVQLDISKKEFLVCGDAGQVTISFWVDSGKIIITLDQETAKKLGEIIVREAEDA